MSVTILSRLSDLPSASSNPDPTPLQEQADLFAYTFKEQFTDPYFVASELAGVAAYSLTRFGTGKFLKLTKEMTRNEMLARVIPSWIMSSVAGAAAYDLTHRSMVQFAGKANQFPDLWKWDGKNGIKKGLGQSFISVGIPLWTGEIFFRSVGNILRILEKPPVVVNLGAGIAGLVGFSTPHYLFNPTNQPICAGFFKHSRKDCEP